MPLIFNGRDAWSNVALPDSDFGYVPFTIQKRGNVFRAAAFDLRTHAGITVAKEYVIGPGGSDGDPGTRAQPFATWNQAAGQGDVDRITLLDGTYLYRDTTTTNPPGDVEVIGEGTVYYTSDRANQCSNWAKTVGQNDVYECTTDGQYVQEVFDNAVLDANGNPTLYDSESAVAAVDANAGSFYLDGGTLYVHTVDSRALSGAPVDGDLLLLDSLSFSPTVDSRSFYFKNVNFRGTVRPQNSSSTGGLKVYIEDGSLYDAQINGVDDCIIWNTTVVNSRQDALNYELRNERISKGIEYGIAAGENHGGSTEQASTAHNGCLVTRINSTFLSTTGQCLADVTGSKSWNLGCTLQDSASGIGFFMDGIGWLDTCTISVSTTDLQCGGSGDAIYHRDLTSGGVFVENGGTISTY